jgi:hypothetical protein
MTLEVLRVGHGKEASVGVLRRWDEAKKSWGMLCFTLEDEARTVKVYAETRIPAGTYKLQCRTHGGFHTRYLKKYGAWHRGMIQVMNVPGFNDILIHIGNTEKDTAGCLLVGNTCTFDAAGNSSISASEIAYKRIYTPIMDAILAGKDVKITYRDL